MALACFMLIHPHPQPSHLSDLRVSDVKNILGKLWIQFMSQPEGLTDKDIREAYDRMCPDGLWATVTLAMHQGSVVCLK